MSEDSIMWTTDMGLVAYMLYHGVRYTDVYWEEGRAHWGIEVNQIVNSLSHDWYGGAASVEPRRYLHYFRDVKKQVYHMAPR